MRKGNAALNITSASLIQVAAQFFQFLMQELVHFSPFVWKAESLFLRAIHSKLSPRLVFACQLSHDRSSSLS